MNNRYSYLFKNIGILSVSTLITKVLTFFLVPLYTNILSTEEYGIYDLFNTTVGLLLPIFTLQIMEGILRYCLDDENPADVLRIGMLVFAKGFIAFSALVLLNYYFNIVPLLNAHLPALFGMYIASAICQIFANFARGIDRIRSVAVSGIVHSVSLLAFNLLFLLGLKWGLEGYFGAVTLGYLVTALFLFVNLKIWKYINFNPPNPVLQRNMLHYSMPFILTSIGWWVNSASDRYVVIAFCGVVANGIYSIGYKIPTILQVFQTIFNQAWVLSSVKDFDSEDKSGFYSNTYCFYNYFMVMVCSGVIVLTRFIAKLMYAKDFYQAWEYVPFLTISVVFGALSGYLGGIFSAQKDAKAYGYTTLAGALINIGLNFLFVKQIGAMGAAIATMISYFCVWQLRFLIARRYVKLGIDLLRDYVAYGILVLQSVLLLRVEESLWLYFVLAVLSIVIVVLFRKENMLAYDRYLMWRFLKS